MHTLHNHIINWSSSLMCLQPSLVYYQNKIKKLCTMKAPTILKNFLLRQAPAAVAPLPEKTRFDRELSAELDTLGGEIKLAQLLDAAIKTQKIVLDSLVKISYRDDFDRGDVDKYLEDNVEILDVCNYFVEKIENINYYVDALKIVVHLVDNSFSPKPNKVATKRALEYLNSSSCQSVAKKSSKGLKNLLRQRLCHHGTDISEILCGSKAMTLMCLRFLELGLSFDSKSRNLPVMKPFQPTSSSWLRLLQELTRETEASVDEKKLQKKSSCMSELQQTVDAARELKEQMKREKEMKCCVERLKKRCKELQDVVEAIEERVKELYKCLIDVRMTLLGILSHH
ncbi:uncharacterized protein LOC131617376 [Vicia villosa]|uniref:uncharacterized protein LOC131617376 n=1 Tax=Vicia villosa TaxID=3911 RepID=UPI00273C4C37|nr:uncharacterized protein LOC131617376 [Vicia villosa]